jgi:gluconate 2-dehydrogenase gamma chain
MSEKPSRRRFLQASLTLIPVVTLAPQSAFSATPSERNDGSTESTSRFSPRYFTPNEWAFISAATEQLIPADEMGPGANECGIPEFIDRQMDTPYAHGALWYMQGPFLPDVAPEFGYQQRLTPREIYRSGIKACDSACEKHYGKPFAALDSNSQLKVLQQLESGEIAMEEMKASLFFAQLLKNSKEGYFSDPIYGGNKNMAGWKMIGFPGARADFMDWIDHPNERYPLGPVSIDGRRS